MILCKRWGQCLALFLAAMYGLEMTLNLIMAVRLSALGAERLRFTPLQLRGGSPPASPGISAVGLLRQGCPLAAAANVTVIGTAYEVGISRSSKPDLHLLTTG